MSRYTFTRNDSGWTCWKGSRGVSECRTKTGARFSLWVNGDHSLMFALLVVAAVGFALASLILKAYGL